MPLKVEVSSDRGVEPGPTEYLGSVREYRQRHHAAALLGGLRHLGAVPHRLDSGVRPGQRLDLGTVDHLLDRRDPDRPDPAVREADQLVPADAAAAAQGPRAPEEVRARPGEARRGNDEALPGEQGEPARLVSTASAADAHLPRAVPGLE